MSLPTDPADPFPRLASKLAEVRRRNLTCFGSQKHQFRWNDPLAEAEVAAFEAEHAIELPSEYRRFLLEAGNGGAGPFYGILPLQRWDWTADEDLPNYLARPALLQPNLPPTDDWEAALGCEWGEFFQGTMTIVEGGCSFYTNLVVSGPFRGRVFNLDQEMNGPPYFTHDRDFLAWYERWLDELLAGYETSWYGSGLPGTEAELTAVMLDPATALDILEDALITFGRMPSLGWEALEATRGRLGHEEDKVRRQVLGILVKHRHPEVVADLIAALRDPVPSVRERAIRELARRPDPLWEIIRQGLADPDPGVIGTTLHQLSEGKVLTAVDVQRFLVHPEERVRSVARWVERSLPPDPRTTRLLVNLLRNPDMQTRRDAVHALAARQDEAIVPDLVALLDREATPEVLTSLVRALGQLHVSVAAPRLIALAGHADPLVRWEVAQTLGLLGNPAAIPALRGLLGEEVETRRRSADGSGEGRTTTIAQAARKALAALGVPT